VTGAPLLFTRPCDPPAWARNGHAQTLLGHVLASHGERIQDGVSGWTRFEIGAGDGDRLCAFRHPGDSGVRVHLLHGLSGDVNSDYMRRTAAALIEDGHEVWAVNHRGCGDGRGLAVQPYHSGKTDDLRAVLRCSREQSGANKHVVIGFSLSGNLGLLYAGRRMEPAPDGLIAINPPVDLLGTSNLIGRGLNRIYELRFMHRLVREVHRGKGRGAFQGGGTVSRWSSLLRFDDEFTAPVCGFESGLDYYAKCSSGPTLSEVDLPAVIIAADDDPFVHPSGFQAFPASASVLLHRERWGGHVGYLDRDWQSGRRWLDGALRHYVAQFA